MTDVKRSPSADLELVVHVPLTPDLRAPAVARAAIRKTLIQWRLARLVDTVVLAASELVTNAIRYGRPPVALTMSRRAHLVRIDVHDEAAEAEPDLHPKRHAAATAESGRGIEIVNMLADEVGCEQIPGDGKTVYAAFATDEVAT